jgi:LmbE family N-acetylglucosaminyl deacetylase
VIDDAQVERVLVIAAHPDDVDFGAGGTVAVHTERGVAVTYCIVTDGDAGGFDRDMPRSAIGPLRRKEQAAAAEQVGVKDLVFLGYPDGRVEVTLELRRDLSRVIRQVRPQRVISQSPTRNLDRVGASHPDHLAVGEAALCAVYPDARNPFAFPELLEEEGLEAWTVLEMWLSSDPGSNHVVDTTEQFERKWHALAEHASQLPDPEATRQRIRSWNEEIAQRFGLGEGRTAEAFRVVATA